MKVVVETNVAIAANGRGTHASLQCQYSCTEFLQKLMKDKSSEIFLDTEDLIMEEYSRHLNFHGESNMGDMFYRYLHDHMHMGVTVKRIEITPSTDVKRGFEELPENPIHSKDRKFLAIAVKTRSDVINALDTDWHNERAFISSLGIIVRQVCPEHGCITRGS